MSDAPEEPRGRGSRRSHAKQYQPKPLVAGILLVLFVVTVALVMSNVHSIRVGGGTGGNQSTSTTQAHHGSTTTIPRNQVKVQVANGTSVNGLAHTVTTQLQLLNWDVLGPLTGPSTPATVIYYQPGFEWAAVEIAHELNVPVTAAKPWATGASQLAAIHPAAGTDIVVLLGPDFNHS